MEVLDVKVLGGTRRHPAARPRRRRLGHRGEMITGKQVKNGSLTGADIKQAPSDRAT
jgi:hypothetical protein